MGSHVAAEQGIGVCDALLPQRDCISAECLSRTGRSASGPAAKLWAGEQRGQQRPSDKAQPLEADREEKAERVENPGCDAHNMEGSQVWGCRQLWGWP